MDCIQGYCAFMELKKKKKHHLQEDNLWAKDFIWQKNSNSYLSLSPGPGHKACLLELAIIFNPDLSCWSGTLV